MEHVHLLSSFKANGLAPIVLKAIQILIIPVVKYITSGSARLVVNRFSD